MEDSSQRSRREFFIRCVDTSIKGREEHEHADALINTPAAFANVSSSVLVRQLVFAHLLVHDPRVAVSARRGYPVRQPWKYGLAIYREKTKNPRFEIASVRPIETVFGGYSEGHIKASLAKIGIELVRVTTYPPGRHTPSHTARRYRRE